MQVEDDKLIENSIEGDVTSFEVLVNRYLKSIYIFVSNFSGLKEESGDIVQETFLKVWKNLSKYKKGESFKAWLFAIARNTAIDFMRKRKDLVFSDFDNEDGENVLTDTLADNDPLPDEVSINIEQVDKLKEILKTLRPIYREILILHYEQDLTFEEIAKILKKPMNTVKSNHRRALIELREKTKNLL